MANFNFIDFYIKYPGHPKFVDFSLIEDDTVRVIIQKYEMIIFTCKGDLLGDPNFGADLPKLLHETLLSNSGIESDIRVQISEYIPELNEITYTLTVEINEDPENFQEYMYIQFSLADYDVYTRVK